MCNSSFFFPQWNQRKGELRNTHLQLVKHTTWRTRIATAASSWVRWEIEGFVTRVSHPIGFFVRIFCSRIWWSHIPSESVLIWCREGGSTNLQWGIGVHGGILLWFFTTPVERITVRNWISSSQWPLSFKADDRKALAQKSTGIMFNLSAKD